MANVCDKFRQNMRQTFVESIVSMFNNLSKDKWFLSIGKPLPWLSAAGEQDSFPPASGDTDQAETLFWQNIIAHKKINKEDVSIVVPRYDWTINTVYQPYRSDAELFNTESPYIFYVLVDEERVYKCIDNNYNAPSLIAPTHTDSDVKILSDGYRWKYLYSITESSKKFLVRSGIKKLGTIRPGYMPVENIESLGIDDERYLQFAIQNSAVDGEIVFVYFLPEYLEYIISDRCIFSSSENLITSNVLSGGITASIFSNELAPISNYYDNMVISIDSGQGQGQRRIIETYVPTGLNTANITVTNPFSVELVASNSTFSIVPNVYIEGDGSSKNNLLDPLRTSANVSVRFIGSTGQTRKVQSFEMADTGKDYTYASLKVVKGLAFASNTPNELIGSINDIAIPIISPPNGHGSNPVEELGGNALMVVKKFNGSENGKILAQNEFRQFGIIKNPELSSTFYRISTIKSGDSSMFAVGASAYQTSTSGYSGAEGKVVSWYSGLTGYTGTSELVLTNVNGTFKTGISGSYIGSTTGANYLQPFDIVEISKAGTEGRELLVLTVNPSTSSGFSTSVNEFPRGLNSVTVGNRVENIENSGSVGRIYRWEPQLGFSNRGKLYLENSHGKHLLNELVGVRDRYFSLYGTDGITGIAKIIEKAEVIEDIPVVYNQLSVYSLSCAFGDTFNDNSFLADSLVQGYSGTSLLGSGTVVGWISSGATGTLSMLVTSGEILKSNSIPYTDTNGNIQNSLITEVLSTPSMKYRSGQVEYIQNMRPIVRSETQEEEIKLIIEI